MDTTLLVLDNDGGTFYTETDGTQWQETAGLPKGRIAMWRGGGIAKQALTQGKRRATVARRAVPPSLDVPTAAAHRRLLAERNARFASRRAHRPVAATPATGLATLPSTPPVGRAAASPRKRAATPSVPLLWALGDDLFTVYYSLDEGRTFANMTLPFAVTNLVPSTTAAAADATAVLTLIVPDCTSTLAPEPTCADEPFALRTTSRPELVLIHALSDTIHYLQSYQPFPAHVGARKTLATTDDEDAESDVVVLLRTPRPAAQFEAAASGRGWHDSCVYACDLVVVDVPEPGAGGSGAVNVTGTRLLQRVDDAYEDWFPWWSYPWDADMHTLFTTRAHGATRSLTWARERSLHFVDGVLDHDLTSGTQVFNVVAAPPDVLFVVATAEGGPALGEGVLFVADDREAAPRAASGDHPSGPVQVLLRRLHSRVPSFLPYATQSFYGSASVQLSDSVKGAMLANVIDGRENVPVLGEEEKPRCLRTLYSHNYGATWSPVTVTLPDGTVTHAHVNLAGDTEGVQLPPYSQRAAPGIIVASGTYGDVCADETTSGSARATLISRDSGLSWSVLSPSAILVPELLAGGSMLAFGNLSGWDENLYFSFDEGVSDLVRCNIAATSLSSVRVANVVGRLDANARSFLFVGQRAGGTGVSIFVNLSNVHERECADDDYEDWLPVSASGPAECTLGRTYSIRRRRPDALCHPDESVVGPTADGSVCPCTREDFDCDVCFIADEEADGPAPCEPMKTPLCTDWIERPRDLQCGLLTSYREPTGYVRAPGDACSGGSEMLYDPVDQPCPPTPAPSPSSTPATDGKASGSISDDTAGSSHLALYLIIGAASIVCLMCGCFLWLRRQRVQRSLDAVADAAFVAGATRGGGSAQGAGRGGASRGRRGAYATLDETDEATDENTDEEV